jgi:hypothetical protein
MMDIRTPSERGAPNRFFHRLRQEAKAFLPPETAYWLVVWLVLMGAGRDRLFQDPGTFWHLAWGHQMLQTGQIPRVDQFSFTRAGQPVVADQWLAELLMALVHRLAGWEGLLLLVATGLAWLYGWMGGRLVRAGIGPLWAAGGLATVFLASAHNFHVRPLIATLILQGLWFDGLLAVEAGERPIRQLWIFVPVSVLWANLHGGLLAGLGTLTLCAVLWLLLGSLTGKGPVRSAAQGFHLAALTAASWMAVLLNPYGLDLPRTWYATLTMNLGRWIQEHRPWTPQQPAGWAAMGLGAVYLGLLMRAVRRGEFRAVWTMPIVWFLLGLRCVRHLPLFAEMTALTIADLTLAGRKGSSNGNLQPIQRVMSTGWPLGGSAPPDGEGISRADREHSGNPSFSAGGKWRKYLLPVVLVGASLALQMAGWPAPLVGAGWVRFSPERWPVGLLRDLQAACRSEPEGAKIFNDLDFGGWVIYFTLCFRVFIDDRCALYGEEFLAAYEQARRHHPAQLDQWQREYGFQWALVRRDSSWDRYLASQPHWQCLGRDQAAACYRRRGPERFDAR